MAVLGCRNRSHEPSTDESRTGKPGTGIEASAPAGAPAAAASVVEADYRAMGTTVSMKVYTDREMAARAAMLDAKLEIDRLEAMMSPWREDSEVARINRAAGTPERVPISQDLSLVLRAARTIHEQSEGVFDVTFAALRGLWHFDQGAIPSVPTKASLSARLPLIDGKAIELDEQTMTARLPRAGMAIDLGGIAKGYAVDRAARVLGQHGFKDVVVQAGGDLLVMGHRGPRPWTVGIRDPRGVDGDSFALAELEDAAFSTAGDYERAFVKDGVRYHHILDPRTGHPARACRSVTVFAPDAFTADQLDDAIFILGPEKGLLLLESREGTGAVIVDRDNRVHVSRRLLPKIRIVHPPTDGI